jgi:methionyl-tRNA formyltransferase
VTEGRARTVFIGSGRFGVESLRRLDSHDDVELVGVVTARARPAGRHGALATTPIDDAARHLDIEPILRPARLRAPESVAEVLALQPDLVVLADYGQIVSTALLEVRHGALNLHPSLLPRHRGATPIPAAILAGDAETGVTLMQMDEGLDTGPIVAQMTVPLESHETTPILQEKLMIVAAALLDEHLGPWIRGEVEARPQPTEGATMTRPLRREDGRLDPRRSAVELERHVRAYQPWPGSFVDTPEGRLIVWKAEIGSAEAARRGAEDAGTFDFEGFRTGEGARLRLLDVQPAGGRRMSWEAFLRGRPSIIGASIVW